MVILSKGCKTGNFEPHNSLKLSFTNIWGLHSNFVEGESFLESNSPDIHALCETNLDDLTDSDNFSVRCYLSLICKDSIYYLYAWSLSLKEGRTSFCMGHRKLCRFSLFRLVLLHSVSHFSSFDHLLDGFAWLLILFHLTQIRFFPSTHLLMYLSLETLTSIIRTG